MTRAYLSLGSNLGDRLNWLVEAVRAVEGAKAVSITALSPLYETAPLGADGRVVDGQRAFLNCVIEVATTLGPAELREITAGIERAFGRATRARWEPRTIDIDLVLFGESVIASPDLQVPHPRMMERAFVLRPLIDLCADIVVPGFGPARDAVAALEWQGCERYATASDFATMVRGRT